MKMMGLYNKEFDVHCTTKNSKNEYKYSLHKLIQLIHNVNKCKKLILHYIN